MKYKKLSAARESNPAFDLNQIGKIAFNRAEAGERHQRLELITAQLMCALTMEAVLNNLGKQLFKSKKDIELCLDKKRLKNLQKNENEFDNWEKVERILTPKEKLKMIAKHSKLEICFDSFPFQDYLKIFEFRNNLVHAKSSYHFSPTLNPSEIDENGFPMTHKVSKLTTDWEELLNVKTAEEWRNAVYSMSSTLSHAANCQDPVIIAGAIDTWGEIEV